MSHIQRHVDKALIERELIQKEQMLAYHAEAYTQAQQEIHELELVYDPMIKASPYGFSEWLILWTIFCFFFFSFVKMTL